MSQADALLNSLTDEDIDLYTVNPEMEEHIVIDDNRYITVPEPLKRIAVQYDHNVETVTFDCPRYWDEHDLSTMYIYINYLRSDRNRGRCLAKNIRVDENDTDIIHFEWTIGNEITIVEGALSFLVCALQTNSEGNEELHWNSEINDQMFVSTGLECTEAVIEEYPDIINDLLFRMDTLIAADTPILDTSLNQSGFAADAKVTGDALRTETIERQNADSAILNTLSTETIARESADNEINNSINDILTRMTTEATARENTDNELMAILNEKVFYFSDIAAMKTSNRLISGNVAKTLGYYSANDGGGAEYIIEEATEDNTVDDCFIIEINNNLIAKLIVRDSVNFKSLGAKDSKSGVKYDCKNHLLSYLDYVKRNNVIKLLIPAGFYCFSPTEITGNGCFIEGVPCKDINAIRGTLFMPMDNKQDYIICIGEQDTTTQNVVMNGITFTSVNPNNGQNTMQALNTYTNTNVITQTLKMINLYACDFKDINFACIRGKALDIASICECNIENIQVRYVYNPTKQLINFANHTDKISNCSALFIDNINIESYVGNIFNFEKDSNVINSSFGTIIIEDRALFKNFYESVGSWYKEDGVTKHRLGDDDYNNTADNQKYHYAIFRFENNLVNAEFAIDKILLNNFSSLYFKANSGSIHGSKTIFNFVGKYSYVNFIVNAIQHMTASVDTFFINCLTNCISSLRTEIKVGHINRQTQDLNYIINSNGMYGIKDINLGTTGFNITNNSYQRFVDYIVDYKDSYTYPPENEANYGYYGGEYYDNTALSKNFIVYRYPNPYYYTNVSDKSWIKIPIQGTKMRLRGKVDSNLVFVILKGNTEVIRKTLSDTDNTVYKWYEIDLSDITTRDDCIIYIKQETGEANKVNILDCFYWKS